MYSYDQKVPILVLRSSNPSSPTAGSSYLNICIVLRKGKHPSAAYSFSHFVSYNKLIPFASLHFPSLFLYLSCIKKLVFAWQQAMDGEMQKLVLRGTWDLVPAPSNAQWLSVAESVLSNSIRMVS